MDQRKAFYFLFSGLLMILVSTVILISMREVLYSPGRFIQQISANVARAIREAETDQEFLTDFFSANPPEGHPVYNQTLHYPFLIFRNGSLITWSDNSTSYDYGYLSGIKMNQYRELDGNKFIILKKNIRHGEAGLELFSFIQLYRKYEIANEYLASGYNEKIFHHPQLDIFPSADLPLQVHDREGKFLFSVEFYPGYKPEAGITEYLFFLIIIGGIVLFISGSVYYVLHLRSMGRYLEAVLVFSAIIILVRLSMIITGFPFRLIEFPVFHHRYYASSFVNSSLGDLLLNAAGILSITGFFLTLYYRKEFYRRFRTGKKRTTFLQSTALAFLSILFVYMMSKLTSSLATHSRWGLDITESLDYPYYKIIGYLIFILASGIFIMGTYMVNVLFLKINQNRLARMIAFQALASILFLGLAYVTGYNGIYDVSISLVYLVLIHYLGISGIFSRLNYRTFVFIMIGTLMCSAAGSISIFQSTMNKTDKDRERFSDLLLQDKDVLTEYFINEAVQNITGDVFIQNRLFTPFASKEIIEQKIRKTYLVTYLNKYDINILMFNSQGEPMSTNSGINYRELRNRFALDRFKTEYDHLYYFQSTRPGVPKRYLSFIPVNRYDQIAGYLIIEFRLKKTIRNNVYPLLLIDERFETSLFEETFDYAIYIQHELSYSSGDFNYQKDFNVHWLDEILSSEKGIKKEGFRHYAYGDINGRTLIITSEDYPYTYFLANYSMLFLIQSAVFILLIFAYAIYFRIRGTELNYLTRIQLYINLAFFIPLLIISITTVTRISSDYSREEENRYVKTAETIGENIREMVEQFLNNQLSKEELNNRIADVSSLSESDINVYGFSSQRGKLLATSQPLIFDKGFLSGNINPAALAIIAGSGFSSTILDENIGALKYKSAYVALKTTQSNELMGIISVPFFSSKASIDRRIIDMLVSMINIFTLIFIGFIFLSFFVSTYLVFPLRQIITRIRKTSLTDRNEPIGYQSSDEIGQLVEAYNNMIIKLEQSRNALALSEKEAGWREMAKQVAHEIKNPLTPMKLTLQHLKRRLESEKQSEYTAVDKAIGSLLHNIEDLNDIATSFSNYAKMPVPVLERFDLAALVKQSIALYQNEQVKFSIHIPDEPIYVQGDNQWLGRAISNIIINSIQSVQEGLTPSIGIKMEKVILNRVRIEISDNGKGIPESIRDKIFIPNFSTKTSGSGIGLAIARRAVEHAGGRIWFESRMNLGTVFYLELPVEM